MTTLLGLGAGAAALVQVSLDRSNAVILLGIVGLVLAGIACVYLLFPPAASAETLRLALTDPLTGLGNARHFLERLERDLNAADAGGAPVTVVLLDVDEFKTVNDRYGHPAGDQVLVQVGRSLRRGGEGFRLGGDEFALLLPGHSESYGIAVAEAVLARIATTEYEHGGSVTASAGVATYPGKGVARNDVVRAADEGLYRAKHSGKDCVRQFEPGLVPSQIDPVGRNDREAFVHAVAGLVGAIRARGLEGTRIGELAGRVAVRMGLPTEHVELIRLAGDVSDVGKLALPDDLLQKAGPLTEQERQAVQRHPEIGHAMLDSLGADPLAIWVRHHHERWDGHGYPERLAGERIPLAARILFVADALDSMLSDQSWRERLTMDEAVAEIARCSGTQFDPDVAAAVIAEFGAGAPGALEPAAA
ncbi:MAG: diguanylate cyclase [Gaiellales bacterium]